MIALPGPRANPILTRIKRSLGNCKLTTCATRDLEDFSVTFFMKRWLGVGVARLDREQRHYDQSHREWQY